MAKQQFLATGEPESKSNVLEPPSLNPLNCPIRQRESQATLSFEARQDLTAGISWPNKDLDTKLAAFFKAIKAKHAETEANFVVKTHPSHPHVDYRWLETDYGLIHLPIDVPYADVMNLVDVMLTHTSGIAAEAIYYGKQVGIINVPGYDAGSGLELHTHLGVTLLTPPKRAEILLMTPEEADARRS
jgi:hypothetical protein